MKTTVTRIFAVCIAVSTATSVGAVPQSIERVSISTSGAAADRFVETLTRPSDSGRFVAFTTIAANLVAGDTQLTRDVFLRDRVLGTTTRVRSNGVVIDLAPAGGMLSYFQTSTRVASLLDLVTDADSLVTTAPVASYPGVFSADGRFALYARVAPSGSGPVEVWRREIHTGIDDLVSATFSGATNTIEALPGFLVADGSIATFTTADPNIVPGDGNGKTDAFYKDYSFGFTDRVSLDGFGVELPGDSRAGALSADTRYFLFSSESSAVTGDANGTWDLYIADRFLGEQRCASISTRGEHGNAPTLAPKAWIAGDGARIIYDSLASNLVEGDTNGVRDIFERDITTGTTRRLVFGLGGVEADADLHLQGVSTDGRYLTLISAATNLVAGSVIGEAQAYLVDLGPQCFVVSYCAALPNSTGIPATIQLTGSPSFSLNNMVLSALDLPDAATCSFFHGTARVDPATTFGNGLRCAGGTVKRLATLQAIGGSMIQFQDLSGSPYVGTQPGDVLRFQLVYRDAAAGGAGFNTTAALEVTFCP